ncbi:MAG TPA: heme-binding domain-containing protein [Anaeromyxobacteraceae bacterium]|nr:heme-binding domain-containing protein [Anaeromyxobacteraceae bacterium]
MNLRRALVAAGVLLLAIQAIPVSRTNPPVESDVDAPPEVKALLRRACYDCHSHETIWPTYAWVAPPSWLVARDVAEGREDLDFSRWSSLDGPRRVRLSRKLPEEVGEEDMPPWTYRLAHPAARLTAAERALLVEWGRTLGR